MLYDEFISSPACNGNARCALTQTASYFAKHNKQLTPPQIIGQWVLLVTLSKWSIYAIEETFRMCADTPGCIDTQGIGACDGNWQCINGMANEMQLEDEYYTDSNQAVPAGDYTLAEQEYYDALYVGDFEYAMGNLLGGFTIVADAYDASFGYGSWVNSVKRPLGAKSAVRS